eukprot:GAHX01001527.1.p1 GENE.GAHX01001527.1~~GAHX01001527.1.p1  ORF type:complete len:1119 (-),score=263.27 GAHX01001527.1:28-3384(-)
MKQDSNNPNLDQKAVRQLKDADAELIKANRSTLSKLKVQWKNLGRHRTSNSTKSVEKIDDISNKFIRLTKGKKAFFELATPAPKPIEQVIKKAKTIPTTPEVKTSPVVDVYNHLIKNTNLKTPLGKSNLTHFLTEYISDQKLDELMKLIDSSNISKMAELNPLLENFKSGTLLKIFILADYYYKVEIDLFGNNPDNLIKFEDLVKVILNQDEELPEESLTVKGYKLSGFFSTLTVLICTDFSIRKIETSLRHFTRIFETICKATTSAVREHSAKARRLVISLNTGNMTKYQIHGLFTKVKEFNTEYIDLVDRVYTILETKRTFVYNDVMKKNFTNVDYFSFLKSYCKSAMEKMKNTKNKEDYVNKMITHCRKVVFLSLNKTPNYKNVIKVMYDQFLTSKNIKTLLESIKSRQYYFGMNIDKVGVKPKLNTKLENIPEMSLDVCTVFKRELKEEIKQLCFKKLKVVSASILDLDCTASKFYPSLPSTRSAMAGVYHDNGISMPVHVTKNSCQKAQVDNFLLNYNLAEIAKLNSHVNNEDLKNIHLKAYFEYLLTPCRNNGGIGFDINDLLGLKWICSRNNYDLYSIRLDNGEFIFKHQNGSIKFLEVKNTNILKEILSLESNRMEGVVDVLYNFENGHGVRQNEDTSEENVTIVHFNGEKSSKLKTLVDNEINNVAKGFISNLIIKHEDIVNRKDTTTTHKNLDLKGFHYCSDCQETTETEVALHCYNCHQSVVHGNAAHPVNIQSFGMVEKKDLFINYPFLFKGPENLVLEDNYTKLLSKRTDGNYIYCEKYIKHLNSCMGLKEDIKSVFLENKGDKIIIASQLKAYKTELLANMFRSKNLIKTLQTLFKDNIKDYFYIRLIKYVLLDMDFCVDMNFFTENSNLNTDRKRMNWIDRLKYSVKKKQLIMASKEFCYSISQTFFKTGFNFNKLRTDIKKQLLGGLDYFDKTVCYDNTMYKNYYKKDLDINTIVYKPAIGNDNLITENDACEKCKGRDNINKMLLCDGCELAYHMYCLELEIEVPPLGSWYCPECCRPLGSHGLIDPAFFKLRRKRTVEAYIVESENEETSKPIKSAKTLEKKNKRKGIDLDDEEDDSFLESDLDVVQSGDESEDISSEEN